MANKAKLVMTVSIVQSGKNVVYSYSPNDPTYGDVSGNVTVPKDTILDIRWKRAQGEKWKFTKPYVSTQKNVGLKPESRGNGYTEWEADNTTGDEDTTSKYYLYTEEYGSTPDPMLTLKGNGGPIAPKMKKMKKKKKKKRKPAKEKAAGK